MTSQRKTIYLATAALFAGLLLLAFGLSAEGNDTSAGERARLENYVDGTGLSIGLLGPNAKAGVLLKVTVVGPNGAFLVDRVVPADAFHWTPAAGDGQYRYEAYLLSPDQNDAVGGDGPPAPRIHGRFQVQDGAVVMPDADGRIPAGESLSQRQPHWLERLVGVTLKGWVPVARAADQHIDDSTPELFFDDTSDGEEEFGEWAIQADENAFEIHDFNHNVFDIFRIWRDAEPHSLVVGVDGSLTVSDGDFFFEGGNGDNLGIGTTTPGHEVHIVDNNPDLKLEDTNDATSVHLLYNTPDFVVNGQNGQSVFRVDGRAQAETLSINHLSDVGLGTGSPVAPLHIEDPFPAIVLRDSNNPGFWEISGSNDFSIREIGGSTSFSIDREAPFASLKVDDDGYIGLGANTPDKQVHVEGNDAGQLGQNNVMLRVENTTDNQTPRRMLELINHGPPLLVYKDTALGTIWSMNPVGNDFAISLSGSGAQEFLMDGSGNVTIQGALTQNSARAEKAGIVPVDTDTVLAKLDHLSIEEWSYEHSPDSRHLGPMAEAFHAAFGLGPEDGIAPGDVAGVALAAAKALKVENDALAAQNERLKARLEARIGNQASRFQELEARIRTIRSKLEVTNPGDRR